MFMDSTVVQEVQNLISENVGKEGELENTSVGFINCSCFNDSFFRKLKESLITTKNTNSKITKSALALE